MWFLTTTALSISGKYEKRQLSTSRVNEKCFIIRDFISIDAWNLYTRERSVIELEIVSPTYPLLPVSTDTIFMCALVIPAKPQLCCYRNPLRYPM